MRFGKSGCGIAVIAAAAVLSSGGIVRGQEAEPSQRELLDTVRALQAKVAQLEAQQNGATSRIDKAVVDKTVADVQKDAERRSQALATSDFTAGWDGKKWTLQSEDKKFVFQPLFQLQVRGVANYLDESPDTGDDDFESGFEMRRTKFGFSGKYAEFGYKFVWATNRANGGTVFLEDAEINYKLSETLAIYGGQFKDPVHHEELISSSRQIAADRSLVNELLGGGVLDRVQGVGIAYEDGPLYATLALTDGSNSDNTNFTAGTGSEFGAAARVEYTVFGDKKAYGDFTALGNKNGMFVIGAGGDISGIEDANQYSYTVDAHWENTTGLAAYGALLGQTLQGHGNSGSDSNFGALAQLAYLFPDSKWEVFGRTGWIHYESDPDNDDIFELTGGLNYYFHSHNAKFTADVTVLPQGSPGDSGLGIRDSGDELQLIGRVQFQLAI